MWSLLRARCCELLGEKLNLGIVQFEMGESRYSFHLRSRESVGHG